MTLTHREAAQRFPEIFAYNEASGDLEMFLDNTVLSHVRKCEASFIEWFANRLTPKPRPAVEGLGRGQFSLDFGIWFHRAMEPLYRAYLETGMPLGPLEMLQHGRDAWHRLELDAYVSDKGYQTIGGFDGAMIILIDYMSVFGNGAERLRVIACELPFGRAKEAPIFDWTTPQESYGSAHDAPKYPIAVYLCGRPDVVVDNGRSIGPLDFKTTSRFSGYEHNDYKPYDALCGYVYGINRILGSRFQALGRAANTAIVTCISKAPGIKNPRDRFKQIIVTYTPSELEEYRKRQLATAYRIYELLVLGETPQWNTGACNNMYHRDCPYKPLHNIAPENRRTIRETAYIETPRWNPTERGV